MSTLSEPPQLYHYTAPTASHLGSILAEGRIRVTESNFSSTQPHAGPDVVWLTDSPEPADQRWVADMGLKARAVLIVQLPPELVHHWPVWSHENGIDPLLYEGLAATGGDPESWWVATAPVEKWHITALTIAPLDTGVARFPLRTFAGDDLSRLFRSAKARAALQLP